MSSPPSPTIFISDSDDATIVLSDVDTDDTLPVVVLTTVSEVASGETEPFEEGEVASTPFDSFADGPLYRPICGPMTYE